MFPSDRQSSSTSPVPHDGSWISAPSWLRSSRSATSVPKLGPARIISFPIGSVEDALLPQPLHKSFVRQGVCFFLKKIKIAWRIFLTPCPHLKNEVLGKCRKMQKCGQSREHPFLCPVQLRGRNLQSFYCPGNLLPSMGAEVIVGHSSPPFFWYFLYNDRDMCGPTSRFATGRDPEQAPCGVPPGPRDPGPRSCFPSGAWIPSPKNPEKKP